MRIATLALVAALPAGTAMSAELLSPGDFIIAIDVSQPVFAGQSNYPGGEPPSAAFDGDVNSKYLNFGQDNSGFIVTPNFGSSTILSMGLITANDEPNRDPSSYALFGTNDAINSVDNGFGDGENWTEISSGALAAPAGRFTAYPTVDFANVTAYTSYRLVFPTLVNALGANSMQIAEVEFYTGAGGTGTNVLSGGGTALAIDIDGTPQLYPGAEGPANAIDNDPTTKFLSFGQDGSGVIVTPGGGSSVVKAMQLTTANDAAGFPERNPAAFEIYGTNDAILSPDNSEGDLESWVLIDSGSISLPAADFAVGDMIVIDNDTAYTSYRIVFTDLVNNGLANSMQISEIQLFDVVPEPGSLALMGLGGLALLRRRR